MSGIFGYSSTTPAQPVGVVAERMGRRMRYLQHTISEMTAVGPHVALGRVAIGIFNRASQPVHSSDGQVWLTLCGEFYHQDARRAAFEQRGVLGKDADDTQLALATYLTEGVAGLTKLDGAFVISVWDQRTQELVIVNDRYGIYPHYYAHYGRSFSFAPEVKGVLAAGVPRTIDHTALAQYMRFQHFLGDRTWFEDVHLLPAAALLRYRPSDDTLALRCYWDFEDIEPNTTISYSDAVDEASRLLQRAIDARSGPGYRLGLYLSGGLDARILLAYLDRVSPLTTISYGDAACLDVRYAAELARRAGSQHHWFPLSGGGWVHEHAQLHLAVNEGMHHWVHSHGISILKQVRELIDVNLSGWDGETMLGGIAISGDLERDRYFRYAPDEMTLVQRLFDAYCQELTWPGLTEAEEATLWGPGYQDLRGLAFDSLREEVGRSAHYPAHRRLDYFFIRQTNRRQFQNQIVLARAAIEVRCPYWDYDFVSFMYTLPDAIRSVPQFRRTLLTRRAEKLALVPYERDSRLPHSNTLLRDAHGLAQRIKGQIHRRVPRLFPPQTRLYADYEEYLRGDLRDWAASTLFDQRTLDRGLFDRAAVQSLWDQHQSGALWTIGKIAPLMTTELALRALHDEQPIAEIDHDTLIPA